MSNKTLSGVVGYKMYPRGFLGAILEDAVIANPSPFKEKMMRLTPTFNLGVTPSSITPNHEVEYLYEKLLRDFQPLKTMLFRKEVLLTTFRAFGTINFHSWCLLQLKSPNFSNLHIEFLNDTVRFIQTGERKMNVETWTSLLNQLEVKDSIGKHRELSSELKSFFQPEYSNTMENMLLQDIITLWTSRHNGFEDLIMSMHVFFGKY